MAFVLCTLAERAQKMKIYLNDEDHRTAIIIPDDTDFSVMIERDYQERLARAEEGEEVFRRSPQEILDDGNREDYNSWHKQARHWGQAKMPFRKDDEFGEDIQAVAEGTGYLGEGLTMSGSMNAFEQRWRLLNEEDVNKDLKALLTPANYDMVMKVYLGDMRVKDYAASIGSSPNTVSKRLRRTIPVLLAYLRERCPELVRHWEK